jgi:hypothetical protein
MYGLLMIPHFVFVLSDRSRLTNQNYLRSPKFVLLRISCDIKKQNKKMSF